MTPPANSSSISGKPGFEADGCPPPNQFRVLIVDDQDANRIILSRLLTMAGYLTSEASDGQKAIDLITSRSVDLVIMDVEMPNMTGLEAIPKIRELDDPRISSLPILAGTGNPQMESQRELLNAGANAYMTKPFDTELLLKTISHLLSPTPGSNSTLEQSDKQSLNSESLKNLS